MKLQPTASMNNRDYDIEETVRLLKKEVNSELEDPFGYDHTEYDLQFDEKYSSDPGEEYEDNLIRTQYELQGCNETRDNENSNTIPTSGVSITDDGEFSFDGSASGVRIQGDESSSPNDIFFQVWNKDIMKLIVDSTNTYGEALVSKSLPKPRYSRSRTFANVDIKEMEKFIGLCLLQGQWKPHNIRELFSFDPLNYHAVFPSTMSGRRFEQILRCLSIHGRENSKNDRLFKVRRLLEMCSKNYQDFFYPPKQLSVEEPLLLCRGSLLFRKQMRNRTVKYDMEFYELCCTDGYVLNVEMNLGEVGKLSKKGTSEIDKFTFQLMNPYLDKGHHLSMDLYYNSATLTNNLHRRRTSVTSTLRKDRRHGIARADQIIAYYSCPRKTIPWYKQVIFYLLDISVWNSFFLYSRITRKQMTFMEFRNQVIKSLLGVDLKFKDARLLTSNFHRVPTQSTSISKAPSSPASSTPRHYQESIPCPPEYKRKKYFLRCKQCYKEHQRKETYLRCKTCPDKPALCAGVCFEKWHE